MLKAKKHIIILTTILLWSCVSVFAGEVSITHFLKDSYASGERTVKSSGENAAMFVNAEFAGGTTNTAKFSLYVSPYLVANQGGRYTKHIYIGSQRIVSKLGDLKSYGADPRRIEYAGSESDGPKVDYKTKYAQQQQVIKDNFAHFDVPYNGADNNDYVDGKGFSELDGSLEGAMMKAAMAQAKSGNKSAGLKDNFQPGDNYEKYQFFYHPDHLGSSSFITNTEGEVVQHIEYVPYGEVFIEERNNVWNSPYLFNTKEFDEETGLYYYGSRYYDSRLAMWYGVDALAEKYPNMGGYVYCAGNPVKLVDPDGNRPTPAEAARMAAHVYGDKKDDILIGGWRVSERYISGVEYNTSHGLKSALYERVGENGEVLEYSYVTCGSETGRDWIENALQLECMSSEYKESAQNAKIISENIGKDTELTFIGHSQGGGEAALNSLITSNDEVVGRSAITFNAAGLSAKTKFNIGGLATLLKSGKEIDAYVMLTCPLNLYQNSICNSLPHVDGNIHLLCPQDISSVVNGHSIDNVLKNFGVNNPDN